MFDELLSHPDKLYVEHIGNMLDKDDTQLQRNVKLYHDIAKLKHNFQLYIRGEDAKDKNHSLLSAYLFLLNNDFDEREMIFGFLSIISHHRDVVNLFNLRENELGKYCLDSNELDFFDEVVSCARRLDIYKSIEDDFGLLEKKTKALNRYLIGCKFNNKFGYDDFVVFKKLYASLIYSDKYEAIFGIKKEPKKYIDDSLLVKHIDSLPFHVKRDKFRKYVLNHFDKEHSLFTLTAPTGYGKTLTALEFALKFQKEKVIFVLPFTSIIDQTESIVTDIFKESEIDIFKVHHKARVDESVDEDRYSQVKFLMGSFSGEINITTLYQVIFALFGNKNRDNVKFNQFKNAVVIIDEVQAVPYAFRQDFFRLCKLVSEMMDNVFIFMSATMPVVGDGFRELSNLGYFKEQNRYVLKWLYLENGQDTLVKKLTEQAKIKHTLCVVNTIKKAQELYLYFKDDFECYALNGYMTDFDKKRVVALIAKRLKQKDKKILLISTQSIEAGIDLDFEVGFREVAPISSIIQTAGRVNRHFSKKQGILYIFDDICGYSDLIYGDLQIISKTLFEIFRENDVCESDILDVSKIYFEKIHKQLENFMIKDEMEKLEFLTIHQKVEKVMDSGGIKRLIIIEPEDGFIKEIESKLLQIKKKKIDKYKQKDFTKAVVQKMLEYGVNVSVKDIEKFKTKCNTIKYLHKMLYLPYGASDYVVDYGVKKYLLDSREDDMFS